MQPHRHRPPEPSFFEQEIAGVPLFVHIMAVFVTCGLYLVLLPFVLLFSGIENRIDRAVDRVVNPVLDRIFNAALAVVAVPAYLLYRLVKLLHKRFSERSRRPDPGQR